MKDRFEYKTNRHCIMAVMPDCVLPSGYTRRWILDGRGTFFWDEMSESRIADTLDPASPEETEHLKAELRKIGYDPD